MIAGGEAACISISQKCRGVFQRWRSISFRSRHRSFRLCGTRFGLLLVRPFPWHRRRLIAAHRCSEASVALAFHVVPASGRVRGARLPALELRAKCAGTENSPEWW